MLKRNFVKGIILLLLFSGIAVAVPQSLTFQGIVTGKDIPASASMTFKMFDSAVGGNQIGADIVVANVPIKDGIFTVELPITDPAISFDKLYFVDITVGSEHYAVRQKLTSVPYAMRAHVAENIANPTLFISSGNRVGIGTNDPNTTLDVRGDVSISGSLMSDGIIMQKPLRVAGYLDASFGLKEGGVSLSNRYAQLSSLNETNRSVEALSILVKELESKISKLMQAK